jgi:hypothetical protein
VLIELHVGDASGHFGGDTTAQKVVRDGYYCPTMFKYAHALSRKCVVCQNDARQVKNVSFPLQPVTVDTPFQQWGRHIFAGFEPTYYPGPTYFRDRIIFRWFFRHMVFCRWFSIFG